MFKFFRYSKKIFYQFLFFLNSKKFIDSFKPDIVHIYSPISFILANYAKYRFNSKIVLSLHGTDIERISSSSVFDKIINSSYAILSVSEIEISKLENKTYSKQISVIGNGFESEVFFNMKKNKKRQIINVGNLRWQKDQKTLIQAFSLFIRTNRNYSLVIVGEGDERKNLEKLIKDLNLTDKVLLLGTRQRDEISQLLNESEFFVLSSLHEGFPKVILESMACGTPIISFDVGNVKKVIQDSGIITENRSINSLASSMNEIANNLERLKLFSTRAINIAQKYNWYKVSTNLDNIYSNLFINK